MLGTWESAMSDTQFLLLKTRLTVAGGDKGQVGVGSAAVVAARGGTPRPPPSNEPRMEVSVRLRAEGPGQRDNAGSAVG